MRLLCFATVTTGVQNLTLIVLRFRESLPVSFPAKVLESQAQGNSELISSIRIYTAVKQTG